MLRDQLPNCRALILTTFGRPGYLCRALEAGAAGFLLKDAPAVDGAVAIRRTVAGERVIDPAFAAEALAEGSNPFSMRERDVLTAAIQKLGAPNRIEAAPAAEAKGCL